MTDSLAPFAQALLAVRWGAVAVSLALVSQDLADGGHDGVVVALVVLLAHAAYRTFRPIHDHRDRRSDLHIAGEIAIAVGAVGATGAASSPVLFALLTPVTLVGFSRGFRAAVTVAVGSLALVLVPWLVREDRTEEEVRRAAEWSGEVVLVALVAGYARRISGEADERREAALDRLGRLTDANVLLFQLHQVTQTLPASFDLTEVLDATLDQVRDLFVVDVAAIVLHDEPDDAWHLARRHGLALQSGSARVELPGPLSRTVALSSTSKEDDLPSTGPGLDPASGSGLYSVLSARGSTIGLLALEHRLTDHFTERDVELLTGFVEPVALAIDNARWFARLRTLGADEERTRIAKDLHDRTGQSLAYLAFELDRITRQAEKGHEVTASLDSLRGDVRKVVGELRDTLYDLRTDVTEADGLASTLGGFLQRVQERSGVTTTLSSDEAARLPLLRERELWRIAREAITGVERLGQATRIDVTWRSDGQRADLELVADGAGGPGGEGEGLEPPGLAALRERAMGIGATLSVVPQPGGGTRVRCSITG